MPVHMSAAHRVHTCFANDCLLRIALADKADIQRRISEAISSTVDGLHDGRCGGDVMIPQMRFAVSFAATGAHRLRSAGAVTVVVACTAGMTAFVPVIGAITAHAVAATPNSPLQTSGITAPTAIMSRPMAVAIHAMTRFARRRGLHRAGVISAVDDRRSEHQEITRASAQSMEVVLTSMMRTRSSGGIATLRSQWSMELCV